MAAPIVRDNEILSSIQCAFDGAIAVSKYDFMYHDTNDVKPASSQADLGTEAANVAAIAPKFMGVAMDARLVGDTAAVAHFPVATEVIGEWDCASATFEVGDYVTIDEDSGGTFMSNSKLVKTTDKALAIGQVLRRYGSATTRVFCVLRSRVVHHSTHPAVNTTLSAYTQTFSTADRTIAAATTAALTHAVGTADNTVDDVGAAFNQTTLNNNFKELTTQIAALVADVADTKQGLNAVIDDLQAAGIVQ